MFNFKAISSVFCINTGPLTAVYNAHFFINYSRRIGSVFSYLKVFNFSAWLSSYTLLNYILLVHHNIIWH
jgi:hypothetical protein